jgi:hypothetical protein
MGDYFCMNVEKDFILHICVCLSLNTDSCIRIGAGTATLPKHLSAMVQIYMHIKTINNTIYNETKLIDRSLTSTFSFALDIIK